MDRGLYPHRHTDSTATLIRQVYGTAGAMAIAVITLALLCAGILIIKG